MDRMYLGFCNHCQEDVVFHNEPTGEWECMACGRAIVIEMTKSRIAAESMSA